MLLTGFSISHASTHSVRVCAGVLERASFPANVLSFCFLVVRPPYRTLRLVLSAVPIYLWCCDACRWNMGLIELSYNLRLIA